VIDLRSWPKKWNDAGLRQLVTLPEDASSSAWPMLGMLAIGLVAGAAIGGYAASQRAQMARLAEYAHRMGDELAAMGGAEKINEEIRPSAVTSNRSNHGRKVASEV
jgi:hypothetical protein